MSKAGRPRIDIDEYFTKIQPFLQLGYSLHKACLYAQIPYTSLKPYYDEDEDFRNKIERERSFPNVAARRTMIDAITRGDTKAALEWLQSMEKEEFSKLAKVEDVTPKEPEEIELLRKIVDKHERTSPTVPPERETN